MATKNDDDLIRFQQESARELLFNIVYQQRGINCGQLNWEFKKRTGDRAMGSIATRLADQKNMLKFLKDSCRLQVRKRDQGFTIDVDVGEKSENRVNERYNKMYLKTSDDNDDEETVAAYREKLLIQACELIATNGSVNCKDSDGNTPLHFIAALPGVCEDNRNLFKYILKAGADPLAKNKDGLNIVHILTGRIKAKEIKVKKLGFGKERIDAKSWEYGYRKQVLEMLIQSIPNDSLVKLLNEPGRDGNTVMHEWVTSTETISMVNAKATQTEIEKELKMASQLLELGANIMTPNKFGLVALHYGCQKSVFKFLLKNKAICCPRNYFGETPLLFILKYNVALPLVFIKQAKNAEEIRGLLDKEIERSCTNKSLEKAIFVLKQLLQVFNENDEVRTTVWCCDNNQVSPVDVLLICLRYVSRQRAAKSTMNEFQIALTDLLLPILKTSNPDKVKQLNKKDHGNPLHDLFNGKLLGITNEDLIISCLEALIQNGADVNAVDADGRTALHLACLHFRKCGGFVERCSQILVSNGARIDVKDKSGNAVNDLLEMKINCCNGTKVEAKRRVSHCFSSRHSKIIKRLTTSSEGSKVVGKFRYFENSPIGLGTFGSIYAAIKDEFRSRKESRTTPCRAVALKRIEKAKIAPHEIEKEIKTLFAISEECKNIVTYYETTEDETFYYISLELMEGDLEYFIRSDPKMKNIVHKDPGVVVNAVNDLVSALAFLHRKKFLHRDLKPGNIMYKVEPLIFQIADFGLAKNTSSLPTTTTIKGSGTVVPGTRCWMAPELVSLQAKKHTEATDVFALGLVLYYLLTMGHHPFVCPTEERQAAHVIEKNIVDMQIYIDESLSSEAKHFIQKMLAKKPNKRLPAQRLAKHPFLWGDKKKTDFLIAVGDQEEAVKSSTHPHSLLEQCLQNTNVGKELDSALIPWDTRVPDIYTEMRSARSKKGYRTNCILDLMRFIRNAYVHKAERTSPVVIEKLENNIFLHEFPTLVLDVYIALHKGGFLQRDSFQSVLL